MREKTPFENCCSNLETVRTDCVGNFKNKLSAFSGCMTVFKFCSYEFDEHFPTGLVICGGVFI